MNWELWGLFSSSFISSTLLPGGSEVALAWLLSQGEHPTWLLLALAISGNSLGGILTFLMGWIVAQRYPAKVFNKQQQVKAKRWLQKAGPWALLLSWLPIIGDPLCLLAGWLRLNPFLSCIAIILGKAVRYFLVAFVFS